jgi:hypothetical protein
MSNFATLSGSIYDIFGVLDTGEQICLTLRDSKGDHTGGYQSPVNPRIPALGSVPIVTDVTSDATGGNYNFQIWANDVITTQYGTATVWRVSIKSKRGGEQVVGTYRFLAGNTYDLSTAVPLSVPPPVTAPTGDTTYARLDGGNMPFTGQVAGKNGTAASPSFAFASEVNTGFFRQAASTIGAAVGGAVKWLLNAAGVAVGSGESYGFSSNADPSLAAADTFISRKGASGNVGIGTTNGGVDGVIQAASLQSGVNPAASGIVRVPNNTAAITARNSANNGDFGIVKLGSDNLTHLIGGGADWRVPVADTEDIVGVSAAQTLTHKSLIGASNGNSVTLLSFQGPGSAITGTGADTSLYSFTLPLDALHATGSATVTYKLKLGTATLWTITGGASPRHFSVPLTHVFNNAGVTNAQSGFIYCVFDAATFTGATDFTSSIDTTVNQTITFTFSVANTDTVSLRLGVIKLIQ